MSTEHKGATLKAILTYDDGKCVCANTLYKPMLLRQQRAVPAGIGVSFTIVKRSKVTWELVRRSTFHRV